MAGGSLEYGRKSRDLLEGQPEVRESVTGAALSFDGRRSAAYAEVDVEAWRRWAEGVKSHLLSELDRHLERAEANLLRNGAVVHWAETDGDARRILAELADRYGSRLVVKGKSMLSEELGLNGVLEDRGVRVFETDLGEYILQLLEEPPSHIVGPAIHRSLRDVQRLFHELHGTPLHATPEALAEAARAVLREVFLEADMGISGGNFLVAETGTLALIENEGNIRLTTSLPPVHVAFVGIEKLLPRWDDLAGFLQLTSRAATGQPLGSYVSLIHGPRRPDEVDGPEAVHVVLVDNGRSAVLADPEAWEVLRCVRCGACANACPVYRQTGGHPYGHVYSGPIGAVLTPGLVGLEQTHPLPFASTLCGACAEVCPVRIPIPRLLLMWRRRAVAGGLTDRTTARALGMYATLAERPGLFRAATRLAGVALPLARRLPLLRGWGVGRALPRPQGRSRWSREGAE